MYQVQLEDLCIEVDAETVLNLEDPDYAREYLKVIRRQMTEFEPSDQADLENQPKEAITKAFRWNHKAILSLITTYKECQSKFETGQCKEGWKLLAGTLNEKHGIKVTPQQCSIKMDTMKRRFKSIRDTTSKTSPVSWQYYSMVSELFGKKSWAEPLQGAISSTLAGASCNKIPEMTFYIPSCSKETTKKKKLDVEEMLKDFKMERQKRDEEKKKRLEEKDKKREEAEIKQEQKHREKMELKRELLHIFKKMS